MSRKMVYGNAIGITPARKGRKPTVAIRKIVRYKCGCEVTLSSDTNPSAPLTCPTHGKPVERVRDA